MFVFSSFPFFLSFVLTSFFFFLAYLLRVYENFMSVCVCNSSEIPRYPETHLSRAEKTPVRRRERLSELGSPSRGGRAVELRAGMARGRVFRRRRRGGRADANELRSGAINIWPPVVLVMLLLLAVYRWFVYCLLISCSVFPDHV